jgi:hypothetical protein
MGSPALEVAKIRCGIKVDVLLLSACFLQRHYLSPPQKHSWRSTFRFHIEDEQFRGLRLTGIATHAVYIRGRFVKDAAGRELSGATNPSLE